MELRSSPFRWNLIFYFLIVDLHSKAWVDGESGVPGENTDGTCTPETSDSSGSCINPLGGSDQVPLLRWRAAAYSDNASSWYGGQFVGDAFASAGLVGPAIDNNWDVLWTYRAQAKNLLNEKLGKNYRLVNHCSYFTAAGQKCHLSRHLQRVQRYVKEKRLEIRNQTLFLRSYDLINQTECGFWRNDMENEPHRHWLVKKCAGGASEGIIIVKSSDKELIEQSVGTFSVAQEYMHKPLLSAQKWKFHARVYILVTRWDPICVYTYDEALVFRSRHQHQGEAPTLSRDVFSSVSKDVEAITLSDIWDEIGQKRADVLRRNMLENFVDVFGNAIVDSFGDPGKLKTRGFDCFDLFGADVAFDEDNTAHLLEINLSPNMWVDRQGKQAERILRQIKEPLIQQVTKWTAAKVRTRWTSDIALLEAAENSTLLNFTRIL